MICIVFIVDDGGSPPSSPPSPPVDARRRGEGIDAIVSMINGASIATIECGEEYFYVIGGCTVFGVVL